MSLYKEILEKILKKSPETMRDYIKQLSNIAYVNCIKPSTGSYPHILAYSPVFGDIKVATDDTMATVCERGDEIEFEISTTLILRENITLNKELQNFEKRIIDRVVPETFSLEKFKECCNVESTWYSTLEEILEKILKKSPETMRGYIKQLANIAYVNGIKKSKTHSHIFAYSPVFGKITVYTSNPVAMGCKRGDEIEFDPYSSPVILEKNITLNEEKQNLAKRAIDRVVPETFSLEKFKECRDAVLANHYQR